MGFSTSATVAIMLIGFLLAAGVLIPTAFTVSDNTGEAFSAQADQTRDQMNTAIEIATVAENGDGNLTVTVTNNGTTALDVLKTDVLLDGEYINRSDYVATVDGTETDIWHPGAQLELEFDGAMADDGEDPSRVKIITQYGITAATEDFA